jgi:hypothetical protein
MLGFPTILTKKKAVNNGAELVADYLLIGSRFDSTQELPFFKFHSFTFHLQWNVPNSVSPLPSST